MADKSKGPGRNSDKVSSSPDTEPKKRLSLTPKLSHLERSDHWKRAGAKFRCLVLSRKVLSLSRFSWRRRTSLVFNEMTGPAREITVRRRLNSVNVS